MRTTYITQHWTSDVTDRDAELRECETRNRATFGDGYVTIEGVNGDRVSFGELMVCCGAGVNIIANSDIYLTPYTRTIVEAWYAKGGREKTCMALSRWDVLPDESVKHHAHRDSQDTWIICGKPSADLIEAANAVPIGIPGCDNRLTAIIAEHGYTVINPSRTIRTYHLHNSGVRTYGTGRGGVKRETVPGPYLLVNVSDLP